MDILKYTASLLDDLQATSREKRQRARRELAEFRSTAVTELVLALQDTSPEQRRTAAELLGRLGHPGGRAALEQALQDTHYRVRRHAALSLGSLADPAAVPVLLSSARDSHAVVRKAVLESLGKLGSVECQDTLCAALKDREARVRGAAAVALGRLGGPESVRPLVDALRDKDPLVCRWAARALGQFAHREPRVALRVAIPELKRRLAWWSFEHKEPYRLALRRIEEATSNRQNLPVPTAVDPNRARVLPVPAAVNPAQVEEVGT